MIRNWRRRCAARFLAAIDGTVEKLAHQLLKGRLRKIRGNDLKSIHSWRVDGFENYLIFSVLPKCDWKYSALNTVLWIFRRHCRK